ncbi:mobilization protein [Pantoea stewartii subsp. stewartii DC283]|uniref:Mobilization protein n=1 Tax=Pantoea stewartii subsp. stewartii DC283 TaxID=660596 RepID=H3RLH0_PANSE|nr:mobilization protein [Pantoea stewartii subsp. stewartii DC283]
MLFDRISRSLSPIVNGALYFFEFLQTHQMILALLSGVMLPFIFLLRKDEHQNAPFWKKLIIGLSMLCFLFGTIAPVPVWFLQRMYAGREEIAIPLLGWSISLAFTAAGLILHILLRRVISPELDKAKRSLVKKTGMERDGRTDVRKVKELLPQTAEYDPFEYIDLRKGIFIGLTKDGEPQYIPVKEWQTQHADIIGTTGAGKGVASGILLYQSILAGEGVFVLDPKNDEWAPHLYKKACEDAGKPFVLIDLNKPEYQMNLIDGITADYLEELFVAGFSLAEKGEAADFYRIDDRKAARTAAQFVSQNPSSTIRDIYNGEYVQGIGETIKAFHGKTEELAMGFVE